MNRQKRKLELSQLQSKMSRIASLESAIAVPKAGWLFAIRRALGMSLRHLATRLNMSPQGIAQLEERERDETVTLGKLREAGNAMGMKLVYGFIPINESMEELVLKRAIQIATEIVHQSAHTMELENQGVSNSRIDEAINDIIRDLIENKPGKLWD